MIFKRFNTKIGKVDILWAKLFNRFARRFLPTSFLGNKSSNSISKANKSDKFIELELEKMPQNYIQKDDRCEKTKINSH